jgi:hypothetical protein
VRVWVLSLFQPWLDAIFSTRAVAWLIISDKNAPPAVASIVSRVLLVSSW